MKSLSRFFVKIAQRYLPEAFLYAVILTIIAFLLALGLAGKGPIEILAAWDGGIWGMLAFSMQIVMVLVTGQALASSRPVKRGLSGFASVPMTPVQGIMLTTFAAAIAR